MYGFGTPTSRALIEHYGLDCGDFDEDNGSERIAEIKEEIKWYRALEELLNEAPPDFYPTETEMLWNAAGRKAAMEIEKIKLPVVTVKENRFGNKFYYVDGEPMTDDEVKELCYGIIKTGVNDAFKDFCSKVNPTEIDPSNPDGVFKVKLYVGDSEKLFNSFYQHNLHFTNIDDAKAALTYFTEYFTGAENVRLAITIDRYVVGDHALKSVPLYHSEKGTVILDKLSTPIETAA